MTLFMREPPCGGFPWGTRQNWTLTGSHVVRLFVNKYPDYHIINLDKLTYVGNLTNLKDIENKPNYTFVKADICDFEMILKIFNKYHVGGVIHLAAESHVDRSIRDPFTFARTNIL